MLKEQPLRKYTLSNCKKSDCTPSTQGQLIFHQSVLELLESKPRKIGTLAVLESCFAASLMNNSKQMFFREISCSMFCERFQQYRPYRVPVKRCVRLSFILICSGSEFGVGIMNFIHESTLSSGYHSIGCPCRITW